MTPLKHMKFETSDDNYFEWPSERTYRTLPRDAKFKTLIFDMTNQKIDRIQIQLSSRECEIYSQEIGGVGIRGSVVPITLPLDVEVRRVCYSGSESRVLRFYDREGNVIADTNPDFEGEFITYNIPADHRLIGFNGTLKNQRNLENVGIITSEK